MNETVTVRLYKLYDKMLELSNPSYKRGRHHEGIPEMHQLRSILKEILEDMKDHETQREALDDMIKLIEEHGDRSLIRAHATRMMKTRQALMSGDSKLKNALIDFRDHGIRHDCNPTLCLDGDQNKLISFFYTYIKGIDDYVRNTSRSALQEDKEIHLFDGSDINEDLE